MGFRSGFTVVGVWFELAEVHPRLLHALGDPQRLPSGRTFSLHSQDPEGSWGRLLVLQPGASVAL